MDPALVWDNDTARWYLYGVVSNGTIWRATFDADGTFNNDWTQAGGSSSSPIIAASGGRFQNFNASNGGAVPTVSVELTGTVANIKSIEIYCPSNGFVVVTATGQIEHHRSSTSGEVWSRFYLTDTSGGTATAWNTTSIANGAGDTNFPFAISKWFSCSQGSHTYYLTGEEGGGGAATATTTVYNATIVAQFFPYSYAD